MKKVHASCLSQARGESCPRAELFDVAADVLVPCAGSIRSPPTIAQRTPVGAVVPAANVPCTPEAERILAERGIALLPDFIVNAGGILGFVSTAGDNYAGFIAKMKGMQKRLLALAAATKESPVQCARRVAEDNATTHQHDFFKRRSLSARAISYMRGKGVFPKPAITIAPRLQRLYEILDGTFCEA